MITNEALKKVKPIKSLSKTLKVFENVDVLTLKDSATLNEYIMLGVEDYYEEEVVRAGTIVKACLMPHGHVYLSSHQGCFNGDAEEGVDFKFI